VGAVRRGYSSGNITAVASTSEVDHSEVVRSRSKLFHAVSEKVYSKRFVCIGSTNTRVMTLYSSSWRFTRCASLMATVLTTGVLLWLGASLLSWPGSGSEVSAAFSMADAPHAEQAANGYGHPIHANYLAVYAEEDEPGDELPKNAALLRALVIVLFFGLTLGWLGVSGWRRREPEVCSLIRCWFHSVVRLHQRRLIATLLGVFLL
jgi:hypothetical protein